MKSEKLKQDQLEYNLQSGQDAHWQCVMLLVKLIQVEIEKDTTQVFQKHIVAAIMGNIKVLRKGLLLQIPKIVNNKNILK